MSLPAPTPFNRHDDVTRINEGDTDADVMIFYPPSTVFTDASGNRYVGPTDRATIALMCPVSSPPRCLGTMARTGRSRSGLFRTLGDGLTQLEVDVDVADLRRWLNVSRAERRNS